MTEIISSNINATSDTVFFHEPTLGLESASPKGDGNLFGLSFFKDGEFSNSYSLTAWHLAQGSVEPESTVLSIKNGYAGFWRFLRAGKFTLAGLNSQQSKLNLVYDPSIPVDQPERTLRFDVLPTIPVSGNLPSKFIPVLQSEGGEYLKWESASTFLASRRAVVTADINFNDTTKTFKVHDAATNGSGWFIESIKVEIPTAFNTASAFIQVGNQSNASAYVSTSLQTSGATIKTPYYGTIPHSAGRGIG